MVEPDWKHIERETTLVLHDTIFLGEGWDFVAYLVNAEFVFRFPKRRSHWNDLHREIAFLKFAGDKLPLAVPRYVRVMADSRSAPNGYAVYRYLPGRPLDMNAFDPDERAAAVVRIAAFLRSLHRLRPDQSVSALLPREDARLIAEGYRAYAERDIVSKLSPYAVLALRELFAEHLGTPANFTFRPAVLHADLSREHLLAENNSVTAVIDFGDVNWGDADYDFTYLFIDFGADFALEVAQQYGHPDVERLARKLRYFAAVDQIDTIVHGEGRALEGQTAAAWKQLKRLLIDDSTSG